MQRRQAEACPTCAPSVDQFPIAGTSCKGGCAQGPGRVQRWSCGDDGGAVPRAALPFQKFPYAAPRGPAPVAVASSPLLDRGKGHARFLGGNHFVPGKQ